MNKRIVFDTSSLVGGILRPGSVPHQALRKALFNDELCASAASMAELWDVLMRPKFDRYLDRDTRRQAAEQIQRDCRLVSVPPLDELMLTPSCRDPRDNKFLALALTAKADAIITSDEDLLILHPWRGIRILTPAEFLDT